MSVESEGRTLRNARLSSADLIVDGIYQGGRAGNAGDDPLGPLIGVSNQGGFRHLGRKEQPHLLAITTSMNEIDWPDHLDVEMGRFTYFGDNRSPGLDLHETPRWGNAMLRDLFGRTHAVPALREQVPPILIFQSVGLYRDVRFLGLAVPGATALPSSEDLIAVWRHAKGQRFQNYKAIFTVLDTPKISRAWIQDIRKGAPMTRNAPKQWLDWVKTGVPMALKSVPVMEHRSRSEQTPYTTADRKMLSAIYERFRKRPHAFEACAAKIAEILLPRIFSVDLTRPCRDGGRDAIGKYRIGLDSVAIDVEFALEAKCYSPSNSVGVKETSRLISRLRHRQFGVLVTTSFVNSQAYKEIREDTHPILIVSGADIVRILKGCGKSDEQAVHSWLDSFDDQRGLEGTDV